MAYLTTEWKNGDTITAELLNKLEQGVQNEQVGPQGSVGPKGDTGFDGATGSQGEKGGTGAAGKDAPTPAFQKTDTAIQVAADGVTFTDLVQLSTITGPAGAAGTDGKDGKDAVIAPGAAVANVAEGADATALRTTVNALLANLRASGLLAEA